MNIPKNLDEAVEELKTIYGDEGKKWFNEKNGFLLHFGVGMALRNNWKLWEKNTVLAKYFQSIGIFHADDMSAIILDAYRSSIMNEPFDLNAKIKHYQNYWNKYPHTPEYKANQEVIEKSKKEFIEQDKKVNWFKKLLGLK